ncbi:MAG: 50S ribosomal protein L9 [Gammaproteobacteria bacterium]
MDVILLEKVTNLGNLGEKVSVRPGYGRNFLMPYGKAVPATKENLEKFEAQRAELEKTANEKLTAANTRSEQIQALGVISIVHKAGEEGKLFGSVSPAEIASIITEKGVALEKREITMPEGPIRVVGDYSIGILLHSDVSISVSVNVTAEE